MKKAKSKASKKIWCLSVEFENGDGPDLFRIGGKDGLCGQSENFLGLLELTTPPPKVTTVVLTKLQWAKAVQFGKLDS